MPKNWCLWTVVLEKTPESPLDSKEIKPVNLKGNQPWILIGPWGRKDSDMTEGLNNKNGFSSSHVWMWELDHKEGWVLKNWCFWTVVLGKTLQRLLDCKEIKSVNPKGNQSWIFIGRTDAEAETPIHGPPDSKSWLIWKDPDVGKDWMQEEKGMTEDEMVGWHHLLNGHEFE